MRVLVAQVSANPDFRMVAAQSIAHAHVRDATAEHTARGATRAAKRESHAEAAETLQAHHTFVWDLKRPELSASRKLTPVALEFQQDVAIAAPPAPPAVAFAEASAAEAPLTVDLERSPEEGEATPAATALNPEAEAGAAKARALEARLRSAAAQAESLTGEATRLVNRGAAGSRFTSVYVCDFCAMRVRVHVLLSAAVRHHDFRCHQILTLFV